MVFFVLVEQRKSYPNLKHLQFLSKVPKSTELGRQISEYTYLGNLGERYSIIMRLLPPSYRMFQPPAVLYDSMIVGANATPTIIVPKKSALKNPNLLPIGRSSDFLCLVDDIGLEPMTFRTSSGCSSQLS